MNLNFYLYLDKYINTKSRDTIVFIEGIGANLKGWDLFVPYFTKEFNVIRYDHPCAGRSLLHTDSNILYQDFMCALEHVLNMIDGNVHIVGYSLGGFVAFRRVICNDKRKDTNYKKIKSITIGSGFAFLYEELLNGFKLTKEELLQKDAKASHIQSLSYLFDEASLRDGKFHNYLVNRCADDPDFITSENFIKQLDACTNSDEWRKPPTADTKCAIPLLLMYAEDDKIIKPSQSLLIKEYFSKVTMHKFEHGGHCFKDIHRDSFCNLILEHIINDTGRG